MILKEYDIDGRLCARIFYSILITINIISFFIVGKLQSRSSICYKLRKAYFSAEQEVNSNSLGTLTQQVFCSRFFASNLYRRLPVEF